MRVCYRLRNVCKSVPVSQVLPMKTSHFLPNYDYSGRPFVPGGISATSNPQPNDHQQHHLQRQPSTQFQQSSLSGLIDHNNASCDNNDVTITSTYSNQLSNSHNNFSSSSLTTVIKLPVTPLPAPLSSSTTIYGNSALEQHHNSSTKYDTLTNTSSTQSELTGNEYNVIRSTAANNKYQQQYNHKAPPISTTAASSSSVTTTKRKRESGEFQIITNNICKSR